MTESEMQQLSREVAEKVGIYAYITKTEDIGIWIHEDNARCFELMVRYKIDVTPCSKSVFAENNLANQNENYSDHNNDAELATRIAILRAVKEVA